MDTAVSSNWAGYVATAPTAAQPPASTGLSFTDVTGSWVQPRLTCSAGEVGAAAFWVGLGGSQDSSSALEQIGTEGDCNRSGKAMYSSWYEFVPAGPVTIKLKVRPGDRMTGAVLVSGTQVTVSLKNLSTHKRFSRTFRLGLAARYELCGVDRGGPVALLVERSVHSGAAAELRNDLVRQRGGCREWSSRHDLRSDVVVDSHRARSGRSSRDELRSCGEHSRCTPLVDFLGRSLVRRLLAADLEPQRLSSLATTGSLPITCAHGCVSIATVRQR